MMLGGSLSNEEICQLQTGGENYIELVKNDDLEKLMSRKQGLRNLIETRKKQIHSLYFSMVDEENKIGILNKLIREKITT